MDPVVQRQLGLMQLAILQGNHGSAFTRSLEAADRGSWVGCERVAEYYYSGPSRYPGAPAVDLKQAFKFYKKSAELLEREALLPTGFIASQVIQNLGGMYVGRRVTPDEFRPCVAILKKFAKGKQAVRMPALEALKSKYWACYSLAHFAYDSGDRPLAAKRYRAMLRAAAELPKDFTQHPGVLACTNIAEMNLKRMYNEMPTLLELIKLDDDEGGMNATGAPARFGIIEREAGPSISTVPVNLPPDCSWTDATPTVTVNPTPLQRPRCAACGKAPLNLQRCSRCKAVSYCGRECQAAGWRTHKVTCKAKPQA